MRIIHFILVGLLLLQGGCLEKKASPEVRLPDGKVMVPVEPKVPLDAQKVDQRFFQLEFFQLALPQSTVTANVDFWKPLDEQFLGVWTHDVLYKNGLRVGRASLTEMPTIESFLTEAETNQSSVIGVRAKDFEFELRKGIPEQSIFYFNKKGMIEARDYLQSDNLFVITFRQTPRQSNQVRLSLAPMIRSQRQRLEAIGDGPAREIRWRQSETIYDLGITLDLGLDECLIIAPSEVALRNKTLVGREFMMEERPAVLTEKVLVIIPRLRGTIQEMAPKK